MREHHQEKQIKAMQDKADQINEKILDGSFTPGDPDSERLLKEMHEIMKSPEMAPLIKGTEFETMTLPEFIQEYHDSTDALQQDMKESGLLTKAVFHQDAPEAEPGSEASTTTASFQPAPAMGAVTQTASISQSVGLDDERITPANSNLNNGVYQVGAGNVVHFAGLHGKGINGALDEVRISTAADARFGQRWDVTAQPV